MKLLRYTPEQLKLIIDGIILGFESINTFNANYCPTIYIIDVKDEFRFEILWNYGTHVDDDERVLIGRCEFKLDKDCKLLDLTILVNNVLDEMTTKPFDSELSDDEFNQQNND
jgi:hypothetical protein